MDGRQHASLHPGSFFSLLGVDAALGRVLSPTIDTPEASRAVVLGHALWQARFGGRVDVLGSGLQLNDELYTVVGVMPAGLYGVLSYSVAQRSREIGIRRALGAQRGVVMAQVIREGVWLVGLGLGLGGLGGLALTRFVASQVQGVSVIDPVSYGLGSLVLGAMALVSCLIPAMRASRVDPAVILHGTEKPEGLPPAATPATGSSRILPLL